MGDSRGADILRYPFFWRLKDSAFTDELDAVIKMVQPINLDGSAGRDVLTTSTLSGKFARLYRSSG